MTVNEDNVKTYWDDKNHNERDDNESNTMNDVTTAYQRLRRKVTGRDDKTSRKDNEWDRKRKSRE